VKVQSFMRALLSSRALRGVGIRLHDVGPDVQAFTWPFGRLVPWTSIVDGFEVPRSWLMIALLIAVSIVSIQALASVGRAWLRRRRARARLARAFAGDRQAASFLERLGYTVLGAQVSCTYPVRVDGENVSIALRADYLVERDGRRYVAEVKTGQTAPRIATPGTRRQLLEYRVAFGVEGVLLVDIEAGRLYEVDFPFPLAGSEWRASGWLARVPWLLAGGAVVALAFALSGR
jgi:hypothetical protein